MILRRNEKAPPFLVLELARRRTDKEKQKSGTHTLVVDCMEHTWVFMYLCFSFKILEKKQASVCSDVKWGIAMSTWSILMHEGASGFYLSRLLSDSVFRNLLASGPTLGSVAIQQGHPYESVGRQTDRSACFLEVVPTFRALQPIEAKVKAIQVLYIPLSSNQAE